ncbi:CAP domain-containing protein [Chitinophaga vietnamensis]|uniref:CAP domain-containing protein n=1 Tax=Chitinophaga vietnamensis TaxID=2593957 RepID=UPI0011783F30|nr:CAP domain-containing protein [Chitinophaga vietnamensis]
MSGKIFIAALLPAVVFFSSCTKESNVQPLLPKGPVAVDSVTVPENHVDRNALLVLVNGLRSRGCKCGDVQMPAVGPLTWNGLLEKAAYLHSKDMSLNNYFNHTGLDGSTPGNRLDNVGYHWNTYGENIAMGNMDEQAVILGWLNSPKHCMNMMNASYTELGVGRYDKYWSMELGHRNNPQ